MANGVPSNFDYVVPNATTPAVLGVPDGAPRGMYPSQAEWQPRVGFAYAIDDKTVFRGGFGIFTDRIQGNPTFYTLNNPPYVGSVSYNNANLSNITGGSSVNNAPWGSIQTIDRNLTVPYSEQFSMGVQRTLLWGLFAEGNFVGTLGRHLLVEPDINQPTFATLASVPTSTNENAIRPYPGFSTIQMFLSEATSNYYGMQLSLSRHKGPLFFTTSYTFSKVLTDASSDTENDEDVYNLHNEYGPATFDARHVFVATAIYNLPTLLHQKAYIRGPAGGWQLSGVIHLQSGFYYSPVGNNSVILSGSREASYLGTAVYPSSPGPNGWWNRAAFAAASPYAWGTAGVGSLEGPGLESFNLSLTKFLPLARAAASACGFARISSTPSTMQTSRRRQPTFRTALSEPCRPPILRGTSS